MSKKAIKKTVNDWGAFLQIPIEFMEKNKLDDSISETIPENTFPFKGIASNGDLNRNGYIIRESAWENALGEYMKNPIVLFQHNDDKALGNTVSASVTENGLEVLGYIYKDLDEKHTGGAVEKNVYRSLSTGHITKDFEFENVKTNEVISKEDFKAMLEENGWGEWMNDWKRAVTALEFVEWSIVAVGSNKASLRTNTGEREFLSRFLEITPEINSDDSEDSEPETISDETPGTDEESEGQDDVSETPQVEETPEEDDSVASAEEKTDEIEPIPVVDVESLVSEAIQTQREALEEKFDNSIKEINTAIEPIGPISEMLTIQDKKVVVIAEAMLKMEAQFNALKKVVDSIPDRKGLVSIHQYPKQREETPPATNGIQELFAKVGVKLKP